MIALELTESFVTVIVLPLSVEFFNTVPSVGSNVLRVKPRVFQSVSLYRIPSFVSPPTYVTFTDKSLKSSVSPYL